MPVNDLRSYIVVRIDEVDTTNRIAHCVDKTNSTIQVSFRSTGAGTFAIPNQGERWLIRKIGSIWYLDHRLDSTDNHTTVTKFMQPGDTRVSSGDGGRVFVEAPVVSGPSTAKRILGF